MELINRPLYSQQLNKLRDRNAVKILTGARGVGKTSLLDIFAQYLIQSGVANENIIHLDFDTFQFQNLNDTDLYKIISSKISAGKNYLLLDEISQMDDWQTAIAKIKKDFDADIYITSSVELPAFDAPAIKINVLPLSLKEFQTFYKGAGKLPRNELLELYLTFGGMPLAIKNIQDKSSAIAALSNIFYSSILRDVVAGSKITDFDLMINLLKKIFGQVGRVQSYNKFSKMFEQNPPAVRTVENYVEHLCRAHMLYSVNVTDLRRENTLKRLAKYYPVDWGYNTLMIGKPEITQEVLETIVYAELLRRGCKLSAYRVKNSMVFQVDGSDNSDRFYVSVVKRLNHASYEPLRAIKNLFTKRIITADENVSNSADGIKVTNIIDFLISK